MKQFWILSLALALLAVTGCASSGKSRSTGEFVDDASISTRTKSALLADAVTDGLNIDVEVDRSHVQLNGFVDSQAQVNRAGEVARAIPGVVSVANNLKVSDGGDRMTGEYIDDKTLQARVNTAMMDDPAIHAMKVDVEINRGEVSLGGFVDSAAERDAAAALVASVDGVVRVVNNLAVR